MRNEHQVSMELGMSGRPTADQTPQGAGGATLVRQPRLVAWCRRDPGIRFPRMRCQPSAEPSEPYFAGLRPGLAMGRVSWGWSRVKRESGAISISGRWWVQT